MSVLTTLLARLIAVWVAAGASWIFVHFGVTVDAAEQEQLIENLVGVVIPVLMTVYAIVHKLISKKINPSDAAAPELVAEAKQAVRASKEFHAIRD